MERGAIKEKAPWRRRSRRRNLWLKIVVVLINVFLLF
jgi:hypothetical protein